ncbi:chlorophyll A-B binding protein [Aureococcus anophagefferens]|nr:chlorophyll A-B binding protein [Aureococcus anophagefferens]
MARLLCAAALLSTASAFVAPASKVAPATVAKSEQPGGFMPMATETFAKDFPIFNSYGWGVSAKAERRTASSNPSQALDFKEWGTLAIISGGKGGGLTITNERACILIANVHFLMVSLCAAWCPLPFQDTLLLEQGEPDEEPTGLIPAFDTGLTPAAEMWNGRLAMLGLVVVSAYSLIYQVPFLTAVDTMLGGTLLTPQ